jgi:hypothetical protein
MIIGDIKRFLGHSVPPGTDLFLIRGCVLGGREQQGWRCLRGTYPGQNAPVLVVRQVLGVDQFDLEIVEIGVVQPKLPL